MSDREKIQNEICEFLNSKDYFDAPYGVLDGFRQIGKGKIREITFGVSRYLDASIEIWNAKKIIVRGRGGLSHKFEGEYGSKDELISHFEKEIS